MLFPHIDIGPGFAVQTILPSVSMHVTSVRVVART